MTTSLSRRSLLGRLLAGATGALATMAFGRHDMPLQGAMPAVPPDPTKVPGGPTSVLGARSAFESPERILFATASKTPLQDLHGTVTPSDLHYERHHAGVPAIDPERYTLLVHGMVERPTVFTLADLKRFPAVTRTHFLECSGNFTPNAPENITPQELCGMTSQTEWTGVPLATLFREIGADPAATWFLAEGEDAAVLARSIPVSKAWDDAMIAYAQNGEALRPCNGYPARLLLPGWEGNTNVKWLRRIELASEPFMTREETSKYTEALKNGTARQFSFVIDARSIITNPCYPERVQPGWIEFRGLAWSGRGRIATVDVSVDEGATWQRATLETPVQTKAHTRFRYLWRWDGREATVLSRATDETGYVQPTVRELVEARGPGAGPYHLNPITGWRLKPDGRVLFRTEPWA